jgi:predicted nucleic acid-binding protein
VPAPVVVDTNILFSALLRQGTRFAELLLGSEFEFFVCESVLVELFRRKDKLVRASKLSEEEVVQFYSILLRQVTLYKEALIPDVNWQAAYALCRTVDASDTPHVALALAVDGVLWTGDKRLREHLEQQGFHRFFAPQ